MGYRLADNTGDTLAVPQLVLTHLCQTDGDTIRAALYIFWILRQSSAGARSRPCRGT